MKPRWLLNANVPLQAVRRLRADGWDVLAIGESEPNATDESVMARACAEQRWLVTFDRDYGELVFHRQRDMPPLVLLFRVPSYRPSEPAEWIDILYASGELQEGSFHVFNGRTVRRRRLPAPSGGRR